MSKVSIDSGLLAALVAGFTLAVQHESDDEVKIAAEQAEINDLTTQLASTNHTLADVQAKLADLSNNIPGDPDPALVAQINTLLGTPDTTGAGTSSTPPPDSKPADPAPDADPKAPDAKAPDTAPPAGS